MLKIWLLPPAPVRTGGIPNYLGGDPPAASATGTLLRLLASQRDPTRLALLKTSLIETHLESSDGRCVQAPGEYSGRHNETPLLCIPYSCGRLQTAILTETRFRGWRRLST